MGETDPLRNNRYFHFRDGVRHSPNLLGTAGTAIHLYIHTNCFVQACLLQTRPKAFFYLRTSQLPSIGLNLIDRHAVKDMYLPFQ
jgi:hypothetical protein